MLTHSTYQLWLSLGFSAYFITGLPFPAQQPPGQAGSTPQPQTQIRTISEAVVLDLVVRDTRGRPVTDLTATEIEVLENGVRQEITSFRMVSKSELPTRTELKAEDRTIDPLRHINLVTLVFERLGNEARQFSRKAAEDFLQTGLGKNTLVAVFAIDRRLYVLQEFTNDPKLLREAVKQATSGDTRFYTRSEEVKEKLEEVSTSLEAAQEQMTVLQDRGISSDPQEALRQMAAFQTALTQAALARITINALRNVEGLLREQQGHASLDSLRALVREQRGLTGRKTLIFFSEGLQIPPNIVDRFRFVISEANRSNVSVYAVDARGLITTELTSSARSLLQQAADVSRQQMQTTGGAVSRSEVMIGESAEESLRLNVQGTLEDLAGGTGGFLIANTNDARPGMRLINEDIRTYYELVYVPQTIKYDGQFRTIAVNVSRPNIRVQTRSGYFALPPNEGSPLLPYELPLLAALNSNPLPRDFEYQARMLHFDHHGDKVDHTLVMEVPLGYFNFSEDKTTNTYRTHFSLMALLKDAEGKVVERFAQDYPLTGPLDKVPALRSGNVIFLRNVALAPGSYVLETVAVDPENSRRSTSRTEFAVEGASRGVKISSLSVIRRADQLKPEEKNTYNPLRYQDVKIVPNLGEAIQAGPDAQLGLHCVIYASPQIAEKPHLTLTLLREGQIIARGSPELPPPEEGGRIPFVATLPIGTFMPGNYEVRATVRQGPSAAEEKAFFTLSP